MRALPLETGLSTFRHELDRFLDRFWDEGERPAPMDWRPELDLSETNEALAITVEIPGIEPKDVQVMLENGMLTIRGEKRQETERKDERYFRSERRYGAFTRSLRLPANVDAAKIDAKFKNGVLTVVMPKTAEARGLAIPVKTA